MAGAPMTFNKAQAPSVDNANNFSQQAATVSTAESNRRKAQQTKERMTSKKEQ